MKKLYSIILLTAVLFFSLPGSASAQSLEETLSNLSSTAGAAYVAPVISGFGSNLNAGWVSKVPEAKKMGLDINLKIIGVGSLFSDDDKVFSTSGQFSFTNNQIESILQNAAGLTPGSAEFNSMKSYMLDHNLWEVNFSGPTIIGSGDSPLHIEFPGQTINGQNFTQYDLIIDEVKGYLDELPALPTVAAQLDIGTVMGTQASFRWFPEMDIQDLGKFQFFGFGLMHNPAVWMKQPLPIDIAVGFFTQTLSVGDVFESTATQYGVFASKTLGAGVTFTPYVGLTMETSNTDVSYDYVFDGPGGIEQNAKVAFELEGENDFGFTVGASLNLVFINLNVDYKMAKTKTASAGISFGF